MGNKNLQEAFIKNLNEILTDIDIAKLNASCNSDEGGYAKETLKSCLEGYDALSYEHSILDAIFRESIPL